MENLPPFHVGGQREYIKHDLKPNVLLSDTARASQLLDKLLEHVATSPCPGSGDTARGSDPVLSSLRTTFTGLGLMRYVTVLGRRTTGSCLYNFYQPLILKQTIIVIKGSLVNAT